MFLGCLHWQWPIHDTETQTGKMGPEPNRNLCWYLSMYSVTTSTQFYTNNFFICICVSLGKYKCTINGNWNLFLLHRKPVLWDAFYSFQELFSWYCYPEDYPSLKQSSKVVQLVPAKVHGAYWILEEVEVLHQAAVSNRLLTGTSEVKGRHSSWLGSAPEPKNNIILSLKNNIILPWKEFWIYISKTFTQELLFVLPWFDKFMKH